MPTSAPLLLTLFALSAQAAELPSPSPTTEVAFSEEVTGLRVVPGEMIKGEVVGVVDAPLSSVVSLVADCESYADWFPAMEETHRTGERMGVGLCSGTTAVPWPVSARTWTIEVSTHEEADGTWRVPFEYVDGSGNIRAMRGGYHLYALGDRTVVAYEGWVDLGLWVPDVILRWGTQYLLADLLASMERAAQSKRSAQMEA